MIYRHVAAFEICSLHLAYNEEYNQFQTHRDSQGKKKNINKKTQQ